MSGLWIVLVLALVVVQWFVFVVLSLIKRKEGRDLGLVFSSAALIIVWAVAFNIQSVFAGEKKVSAPSAVSPATPRFTCASIDEGMTAEQVRQKLGKPDQEASEEDTRGPGAVKWTYNASRCSVHLVDGVVELID